MLAPLSSSGGATVTRSASSPATRTDTAAGAAGGPVEAEVQAEFDAKSEKVLEILESKDAQIRGLESELRTATESSEQRAAELRQV